MTANVTAEEKNVAGGIERQTQSHRGLVTKMRSAGVAWTNNAHTVADVVRKAIVAQTNVSGKT